jgi:hypothetical protein
MTGFQKGKCRIDKGRRQGGMGDTRAIIAPALGQGLAQHSARERSGGFLRLRIERRQQEGPHQPFP